MLYCKHRALQIFQDSQVYISCYPQALLSHEFPDLLPSNHHLININMHTTSSQGKHTVAYAFILLSISLISRLSHYNQKWVTHKNSA